MPELPEVETMRRQMERALKGKKILSATVRYAGRLNVSKNKFNQLLKGATFKSFRRRAKLLLIDLSNGWTMVVHLKMTGSFLFVDKNAEPDKHTHIYFDLSGGKRLFWRDVRKFGYIKLFKTKDIQEEVFEKAKYGPEPLEPDFTFRKFRMCVTGRPGKKIKPLLLDQTCIAGIGNIYADESLWEAKVHPATLVKDISESKLKGIYQAILKTLKASVKRRGTSSDTYLDLYGKKGTNSYILKVYGMEGKKCQRCGSPIHKEKMNARGTHFCKRCQKLKK